MKLQLRYNPQSILPIAAAFIRGSESRLWLQEIGSWNMDVTEISCLIVPESIENLQPAGLLVLFKNATKINELSLLEPFACIGEKLFIPLQTKLYPEISPGELKEILLWDVQMMHPVFGFVGFEKTDEINLADLFGYDQESRKDWSYAHPGTKERAGFRHILVEQPGAEELMASFQQQIGEKPLEDIPVSPKDKQSLLEKTIEAFKFVLLGGLLNFVSVIEKILPPVWGSHLNVSNRPGLLQQFQRWLDVNLKELEQKRNNEIQRLLKLFDENNDEALQYAIPLNSPYLNRGNAQPSGKLTRNPVNFNLGRLGGGRPIDGWDLGRHYNDLRGKYLRAAKIEITQKDFKKAAYIYAHLLGDYTSAANILEQGKFFREAAALYKDHLKNIPSAAECLERGGLLHEAIILYKELHRDEKTGDLFRQLHQDNEADIYFEKHIKVKFDNNDYLDAARVIKDKLRDEGRAKEALLNGWNYSYQAEPCLKGYFDLVKRQDNSILDKELKEIYHEHLPGNKRLPFLNVLEYIHKSNKDESLAVTTRNMVYEILHSEAEQGNLSVLNSLRKFLPADPILSSDSSRYISRMKTRKPVSNEPTTFQLDQSIQWIKGSWHRNQFLLLGLKNDHLHLARMNWYGNIEYYDWTNEVAVGAKFHFISAPYFSNQVILHSSDGIPVTRKNLPKNKYFNEALIVNCPIWMHRGQPLCVINEEQKIIRLEVQNGSMTIHEYAIDGSLKISVNCVFNDGKQWLSGSLYHPHLKYYNGYFYTFDDKSIFAISKTGVTQVFPLDTIIRFIAISQPHSDPYLIASTNRGVLLLSTVEGRLVMKEDFFAIRLIPTLIVFISAKRFVIAHENVAVIFEISEHDSGSRYIREFKVDTKIIDVFPGKTHNQFAVAEKSGRITIFEIG